jgi:hypothetical protein
LMNLWVWCSCLDLSWEDNVAEEDEDEGG